MFDTAIVRVPVWAFRSTVGRFLPKGNPEVTEEEVGADEDSDAPQHTPSTDSAGEDFELVDQSTDSLSKGKTSGAQLSGKSNKRKGKKR